MSRRQDFTSPEGLRQDGRRPQELRSMEAALGILQGADGSATFKLGNTHVLASVHGPREFRGNQGQHDRALIQVALHTATFSSVSGERRRRQTRMDRKQAEWATFLQAALEAAIMTTTFPRSQIDIFVEVLNADGGVLAAAFNAACLALIDAGVPMVDYLVAVSCAFIQGQALLDLNRLEEASNNPSMTVAFLPRSQTVSFMAVEPRLEADRLASLMELALNGATHLWKLLDQQYVLPYVSEGHKRLNTVKFTSK